MKSTTPPSRPGQLILAEVLPIVTAIYSLLEAGNQKARKFTDEECEGKYDPWLSPMIVRNVVCRGLDALSVGEIKFERRDVANDGIELKFGKYTIKVWKATPDGQLPPTDEKDSQARIAFCNGNLFSEDVIVYRNLVVIWDVNAKGELRVQLVAPRAVSSQQELGQQLWAETVPHPAIQIKARTPEQGKDDDLGHFEAEEKPTTQTGEREGEDE